MGGGLPEASVGGTAEAGHINGDAGPKETIQDLLALAGPFPTEWNGHGGPFGTLCGIQRREALN